VAVADEAAVAEYAALAAARAEAAAAARAALTQPAHVLPFLQPGRLVRVLAPAGAEAPGGAAAGAPEDSAPADAAAAARLASNGEAGTSGGARLGIEDEGAWAAVVNFERVGSAKAAPGGGGSGGADSGGGEAGQYIVDVLVNCAPDSVPGRGPRRRARRGDGTLHAEPCCQCVRHACRDRVLPQMSKPQRRSRHSAVGSLHLRSASPECRTALNSIVFASFPRTTKARHAHAQAAAAGRAGRAGRAAGGARAAGRAGRAERTAHPPAPGPARARRARARRQGARARAP